MPKPTDVIAKVYKVTAPSRRLCAVLGCGNAPWTFSDYCVEHRYDE